MTAIKNNYIFQLAWDLPTSGTSVKISNDLERDQTVVFTSGYVVLRSGNKIERVKWSATGWTLTLSKRGLDQSDTDVEVTALKKDWKEGTTCYVTVLAVQLQEVIDTIASWALLPPSYADDTARDAAITSPVNGMLIYNVADGLLNKYVGWAWVDDEGWAVVANGSETVAGKVEVSTDAEITAWTATWGTWAALVTTPTQIKKSISLKNTTTTTSDSDLFVVSQSWEDKSITQTLLRDQLAASTTKKGTVEMATDAEATTGTDESRYVNSKQVRFIHTESASSYWVWANNNIQYSSVINLSSFWWVMTINAYVNSSWYTWVSQVSLEVSDNWSTWWTTAVTIFDFADWVTASTVLTYYWNKKYYRVRAYWSTYRMYAGATIRVQSRAAIS